MRGARKSH
jgi:5-oxoprolinase (ATP-hydrolysing)